MKKIILILITFITFQLSNSQVKPPDEFPDGVELPYIDFKQQYTIAERDALTVGVNDRKLIYVVDTGINENQIWDGTNWTATGVGTTPTIQQVLTAGNIVSDGTTIQFDDIIFGTTSELLYDSDELIFGLKSVEFDLSSSSWIGNVGTEPLMQRRSGLNYNIFVLSDLFALLNSNNPDYQGLLGLSDFSANYAADDNAYPQVKYVNGIVSSASVTGTQDIDWKSNITTRVYTLTGATTFTESNLQPRVISFIITGDFAWSPPTTWTAYSTNDTYDGTVDNHIVVEAIVTTSGSEKIYYSLKNM
jgi:hypothetical protein